MYVFFFFSVSSKLKSTNSTSLYLWSYGIMFLLACEAGLRVRVMFGKFLEIFMHLAHVFWGYERFIHTNSQMVLDKTWCDLTTKSNLES